MSTMPLAYQKPLRGRRVGVAFGSFAPLHQGHLDMIYRAKKENDGGCIVIVCGNKHDKGGERLPLDLRYQYTREFFKDDDLVAVYAIDDDELGFADYAFENWHIWLKEFDAICARAIGDIEHSELVWYVGEPEYARDLNSLGRTCIYMNRAGNPISGTMIRNNPFKYWDKIALPFRRAFSHNILIIGTASEGKSVLTIDLAKYFGTVYAHEWPRDYMEKYALCDWELTEEEFAVFLHGQHQHIKEQIESPANRGVFFADSDAMTTDMYAHHYVSDPDCKIDLYEYRDRIAYLSEVMTKQCRWDKIFVLPPHSAFVDDHVRYMHDADVEQRKILYGYLVDNLKYRARLWDKVEILNGDYNANFEAVKRYVNDLYRKAE